MPKRGACSPLVISDYIDHLALLTQGFTYLNNLKYSLKSLALAMLACLPSLFVNARVCSKPSIAAQPETNHQASKQSKKKRFKKIKNKKIGPRGRGGRGWVGGKKIACAPSRIHKILCFFKYFHASTFFQLLDKPWSQQYQRCRPFSPPVLPFDFYRAWGSATPLLVDFLSSVVCSLTLSRLP